MSFRLWMIFYAFAELAAAMALFGPLGILVALAVLGFWAYSWNHGYPTATFSACVLFVVILALVWAFLPEVTSARVAARRSQCMNNMKQIALALLNYESANGSLPPAFVADANGKPMHSWRVLVLPYIEEQALFKKYNFNEPWNGPNNSKLADQMPEIFRCPSDDDTGHGNPGETSYFVAVGPTAPFLGSMGRPFKEISDGTANTILLIEASGLERNWMDPQDVTLEEAVELLTTKPRSGHRVASDGLFTTTYFETSTRNVVFCDGHVVYMDQLKDSDIARALLTCAGGEQLPAEATNRDQDFVHARQFVEPVTTTVIKWGRIWGLSVFIILSLLPAVWMRRRNAEGTTAVPA